MGGKLSIITTYLHHTKEFILKRLDFEAVGKRTRKTFSKHPDVWQGRGGII